MKINIEQSERCGSNQDQKQKEKNETKLSFCLEQCIVENKPKTNTHTRKNLLLIEQSYMGQKERQGKENKNVDRLDMNSLNLEFMK
jgi:hypothetical protein